MKLYFPAALAIAAALGVAGCGVAHPIAAAHSSGGSAVSHLPSHVAPSPSTAASLPPSASSAAQAPTTTVSVVGPHFSTPQAAMRYLAAAANRGDVAALHHVTTPSSFKALMAMRREAVDLRLKSCAPTGHGDYYCVLQHRYPKRMHKSRYGAWDVIVAPAVNPGWYLYVFEGCG